jgi:hypothetical protein
MDQARHETADLTLAAKLKTISMKKECKKSPDVIRVIKELIRVAPGSRWKWKINQTVKCENCEALIKVLIDQAKENCELDLMSTE